MIQQTEELLEEVRNNPDDAFALRSIAMALAHGFLESESLEVIREVRRELATLPFETEYGKVYSLAIRDILWAIENKILEREIPTKKG